MDLEFIYFYNLATSLAHITILQIPVFFWNFCVDILMIININLVYITRFKMIFVTFSFGYNFNIFLLILIFLRDY